MYGWKDLFVAQGHVLDNVQDIDASLRYKEVPLLAMNHTGRFERVDSGVTKPMAARGVACGDTNNDGYMDAVISCLGGPPVLLLNRGREQITGFRFRCRGRAAIATATARG